MAPIKKSTRESVCRALETLFDGVGFLGRINDTKILSPDQMTANELRESVLVLEAEVVEKCSAMKAALGDLLRIGFDVPDSWLRVHTAPDIRYGDGNSPHGDRSDYWCLVFGLNSIELTIVQKQLQSASMRAINEPGYIEKKIRSNSVRSPMRTVAQPIYGSERVSGRRLGKPSSIERMRAAIKEGGQKKPIVLIAFAKISSSNGRKALRELEKLGEYSGYSRR